MHVQSDTAYALRDCMAPIISLTFPHRIMPTLSDRQTTDTDYSGQLSVITCSIEANCPSVSVPVANLY